MISLILGGLFVTALFGYMAIQLKKRDKWPIVLGLLMTAAGLGLVGIAVWLAGLATSMMSVLIVGAIALILCAGLVLATIADLSDKKLDHPWYLFAIPSLLAVVLVTGSTTFDYLVQNLERNVNTLTSQVGG